MFTLFSVLSLASGVAVTTAVYSVVDTLFLRDLGVPRPDRAAFVVTSYGGRAQFSSLSAPDFERSPPRPTIVQQYLRDGLDHAVGGVHEHRRSRPR